jgi:hypothetical protein
VTPNAYDLKQTHSLTQITDFEGNQIVLLLLGEKKANAFILFQRV